MRISPDGTTVGRDSFVDQMCSQVQVGIWHAEQLGAGSRYHMPLALWLRGRVATDALNAAFRALLVRHPLLLSCYPAGVGGGPVRAPYAEDMPMIEHVSHSEPLTLGAILRERTSIPFDLTRGPLVRGTLIQQHDDLSLLHLVFHHLVFDGISRDIVARDLAGFYDSEVDTEPLVLAPLPDYGCHVQAQRLARSDQLDTDTDTEPSGPLGSELSECFARMTGRPDPGITPDPVEVVIGPRQRSGLAAIGAAAGVTAHTALVTTFAIVLDKYCSGARSGLPALAIPMDTRSPDFRDSVGPFVNERKLVLPPTGDSFLAVLGAVAKGMRRLIALRTVAGSGAGTGGITFGYRRASPDPITMVGLEVEYSPVLPRYATGRELEVQILDDATQMTGWVDFDPQRFDGEMVQQLVEHWLVVIAAVVADPERSLAELQVLAPAERNRMVREWNSTDTTWPGVATVHGLFEAQVARTPDAVAVRSVDGQLDYAEINRRAECVAHRLAGLGVGPESLVAICAQRSPDLVIGLLGVLKAGAAYVPLEPEYPPERLAYMLTDSVPAALLTQQRLLTTLPEHSFPTVLLDHPQTYACEPETTVTVPVQASSAAYAIYTSGSTGWPKAAVTSHGALSNRLLWMQDAFDLQPTDRVLQKTPSSFDVSVWEFFWPLLCGASLVLAAPGGHRDSGYLAALISQAQVTTLHFVPSMLRAFLDEPGLETSCASLRNVFCSGEELPADLARRFAARLDATLHNLYGPTEASIDVSAYTCLPDEPGPRVPIGWPIANTALYVLDPNFEPVPAGVTGELHIGGDGLARGYHGRPALTADRFVPDRFGCGGRLYRTGDLARYRSDGALEFLGRADSQVKIRGQRVEPAEIETALRAQPGVGDAAVLARSSARGEWELVAYVVPADPDGESPSGAAVLTGLRRSLTGAMIPSSVVVIEALPLTPNGKLDRQGLAPPPVIESEHRRPKTAVEGVIAEIWADVFEMDRISVEDDFFTLGGESLLATRILARLRSTLGVTLPLRTLFDRPTIAGLAAAVEAGEGPS